MKSYSERLFRFEEIDALSGQDAKDAIVKPAEPLGGSYTEEALRWIISETQGYPYFIQELMQCNMGASESGTDGDRYR